MKTRGLSWLPALTVMAVIFLFSSLPGDQVPLPGFRFSDKVAHLAIYTLLGMALAWRLGSKAQVKGVRAAPIPVWDWLGLSYGWIYAASDEVHQIFVPGRHAGWDDWSADAVGIALGLAVVRLSRRKLTGNSLEPG